MELENYKIDNTVAFCVINRKGGVGKTAVSLSLAKTYANAGFKVLVIDSDPQASASNILGINSNIANDPIINMKNISALSREYKEEMEDTYVIDDLFGFETEIEQSKSEYCGLHDLIWEVIQGNPLTKKVLQKAIITPTYKSTKLTKPMGEKISLDELADAKVEEIEYGFDLLPASEELTDDELYLGATKDEIPVSKISIFKTIVSSIKKNLDYNVIIIDCGPSLGIFSLNSIFSSDGAILVGMPDKQSLHSLAKTKKNFRDLKTIDPSQRGILGFVLNACPSRNVVRPIMEHAIKSTLGINFYENVIPQSSKASQASTTNRVFVDVDKKAAESYKLLASEILQSYYDNEEWEKQRDAQYATAVEELLKDSEFKKKVEDETLKDTETAIAEKGVTIEQLKEQNPENYQNIYKYFFDNNILKSVKEEYEKGNLWKRRTNKFHVKLEGENHE